MSTLTLDISTPYRNPQVVSYWSAETASQSPHRRENTTQPREPSHHDGLCIRYHNGNVLTTDLEVWEVCAFGGEFMPAEASTEELRSRRGGIDSALLLAEKSLAEDWLRPEEDEAWAHLQ